MSASHDFPADVQRVLADWQKRYRKAKAARPKERYTVKALTVRERKHPVKSRYETTGTLTRRTAECLAFVLESGPCTSAALMAALDCSQGNARATISTLKKVLGCHGIAVSDTRKSGTLHPDGRFSVVDIAAADALLSDFRRGRR